MITTNPGDALAACWSRQIGRLTPGSFGDVTVIRPRGTAAVWTQIVNATENEIMLVVVGGKARYGDPALMTAASTAPTTKITVNGTQRSLALAPPTGTTATVQWSDVVAQIDAVRKNPAGTANQIQKLSASPHPPLQLELDMPIGSAEEFAGPPPDPSKVVIPPLPTLVHDPAFFNDIHGRGFHNGLLDGRAAFYKS